MVHFHLVLKNNFRRLGKPRDQSESKTGVSSALQIVTNMLGVTQKPVMAIAEVSSIEEIKTFVSEGTSYKSISKILQERSGITRGISAANIRLFCKNNCIGRRSVCSDEDVDRMVFDGICEVRLNKLFCLCNYHRLKYVYLPPVKVFS